MKEVSFEMILETAGFKYEETTALMHKTGFFQDKVDDPLSSSLGSLAEANVSKFEVQEAFCDKNKDLADLVNKVSNYINAWIKDKSITEKQLFNCVMANYFSASDVVLASQSNTNCLITLREKFNGDINKFVSEINKTRGIERN
jgi:hypothetical protein